MTASFEIPFFFSTCCYYYYHYYYYITSRCWFLRYTYSNFENLFFGLSNLEFFIQSLYAWNVCLQFFFLSLSFISFIFFLYFLYIFIYVYVYVFSTCTDLVEKGIRFPQDLSLVLYVHFRIFYFCIIELWVLVNLKYRKKKKKNAPTRIYSGASKKIFLNIFFLLLHKTKMIILVTTNDKCSNNLFKYQTVLTTNKKVTR